MGVPQRGLLSGERARSGERTSFSNAQAAASEPSRSEEELLRAKADMCGRIKDADEKRRGFEARVGALEAAISLQSSRNSKLAEENKLLEEKIRSLQGQPSLEMTENAALTAPADMEGS